jgi:hypothetical protein
LSLRRVQRLIRQDGVLHQEVGGVGVGSDRLINQAGRLGVLQTTSRLGEVLKKAA